MILGWLRRIIYREVKDMVPIYMQKYTCRDEEIIHRIMELEGKYHTIKRYHDCSQCLTAMKQIEEYKGQLQKESESLRKSIETFEKGNLFMGEKKKVAPKKK